MLEEKLNIKNMIYEIRGKQVMLDSDLAKLYQCKNGTKSINLAVRRHINRFPERFMFKLNKKEYLDILRFQNETLELEQGQYSKYLPFVFTEQGVAMLATIIHTDVAEKVSINIMDAFVEMRKYISNSLIEQKYINNLVLEHDTDIKVFKELFDSFKEKTNQLYFPGQIFDSYAALLNIFHLAKNNLIIIDPYSDESVLNIISKLTVKVTIICKDNNKLTENDINKYNSEYNNLNVIRDNNFHDRYFIIDKKEIYHCGTSINNAGNKIFSINKLEDKFVKQSLLDIIGSYYGD